MIELIFAQKVMYLQFFPDLLLHFPLRAMPFGLLVVWRLGKNCVITAGNVLSCSSRRLRASLASCPCSCSCCSLCSILWRCRAAVIKQMYYKKRRC